MKRGKQPDRAFTLVEAIAVLTMIVLVALTVLPAMANSKMLSRSIRCLDNLRQLTSAVEMYTHDNHDLFPPNPDDGTQSVGYTWCTGEAGPGGSDEFDPDLMSDPKRCLLALYTGTNVALFRCTADTRVGRYDGGGLYPASPLIGKKVPAARTVSINMAVGTIDPQYSASGGGHSGVPSLPVNGPWLTGSYNQNTARFGPYHTYGKTSDVLLPLPSQLLVITEEGPYSINDGGLAGCANLSRSFWIDYPSALHNNACVIGFADGHVELHKWLGQSLNITSLGSGTVPPADPDFQWVARHISAHF